MIGYRRITKHEFYLKGAWANSRLARKADKLGRWMHFERLGD